MATQIHILSPIPDSGKPKSLMLWSTPEAGSCKSGSCLPASCTSVSGRYSEDVERRMLLKSTQTVYPI